MRHKHIISKPKPGDTTMSSNMKRTLFVFLVLATCGAASAAMAGGRDDDLGANGTQVDKEWLHGQHGVFQNHPSNGGAVYDYIGNPDRSRSPSYKTR
jgi:hypothetical protein